MQKMAFISSKVKKKNLTIDYGGRYIQLKTYFNVYSVNLVKIGQKSGEYVFLKIRKKNVKYMYF